MIIAVYGIPRSGKDTFISKLLAHRADAIHLKGSRHLNALSSNMYHTEFKNLGAEQQDYVRRLFTEYVKKIEEQHKLVVVDGHYSFPDGLSEHGYVKVFTECDLELYDVFFYLRSSADEISRNFYKGDKKEYSSFLLSSTSVDGWTNFEIEQMKIEVEGREKDFIVIDSSPFSVEYVQHFDKTAKVLAQEIAGKIKLAATNKSIVLTDLDKTISQNDLTDDFIKASNLDYKIPKAIFRGDYYTTYQFYLFHNYLKSSKNYNDSIQYALSKLCLNERLIEDLFKLKKESCIVGLTTGMLDAWKTVNKQMNLFDELIGYGYDSLSGVIVTPFIKKLVARYLSETSRVMGIGDSIIDLGMIQESHKGYLVSMNKLDKRIIRAKAIGAINKKISQPKYSTFKYDFIQEEDVSW